MTEERTKYTPVSYRDYLTGELHNAKLEGIVSIELRREIEFDCLKPIEIQ